MTAPWHIPQTSSWELEVRRLRKNACLDFPNVALPSLCQASFFFIGLSLGSSTVVRPYGNRRAALSASFQQWAGVQRIILLADVYLPLACTGLRCPGSSEAASMEGLGIEGSEWQGGTICYSYLWLIWAQGAPGLREICPSTYHKGQTKASVLMAVSCNLMTFSPSFLLLLLSMS